MKVLLQLILGLAVAAAAAGAVGATTAPSAQSDQQRRDQNNAEALANYRASGMATSADHTTGKSMQDKTHHATNTVAGETHEAADSVRNFGHRQAQHARDFTDHVNQKYGTTTKPNLDPQGGK